MELQFQANQALACSSSTSTVSTQIAKKKNLVGLHCGLLRFTCWATPDMSNSVSTRTLVGDLHLVFFFQKHFYLILLSGNWQKYVNISPKKNINRHSKCYRTLQTETLKKYITQSK